MTDEERDAQYGSAETAKTYAGLIEAVNIFAKYTEEGLGKKYAFQAGHDIIYFYTDEPIAQDAEDGVRLNQLGFLWDEDAECWGYFT